MYFCFSFKSLSINFDEDFFIQHKLLNFAKKKYTMKFEIKTKQIAEGFINLTKSAVGTADKDVEEMYHRRMAVCAPCPSRKDLRCGECGCVLAAKGRVKLSACPLDKWEVEQY